MKRILIYTIVTTLVLVTIGFASVKRTLKPVNDVSVQIETLDGNYFTDKQEVLNLLNAENTDYVLGSTIDALDLKTLERRVEVHPFVKEAQIFKDLRGNLIVNVRQAKPIARIYSLSGDDLYIDSEGYLLPTLARQTARVPIIELETSFSWEENVTETAYGRKLLALISYIETDKFWNAQIAGFTVQKNGEIVMQPQVTKQEILFGMPEDFDQKFKKLRMFYKEILPNKGWNTYNQVNLKFKDQIVCN